MELRSANDFDAVVEQTNQALIAFVQGDSSAITSLYSRGDDAVLANPLGPPLRGGSAIVEESERMATNFRDGTIEFEEIARYATPDLGYLFHIERSESKIGTNAEPSLITLRVTMIYRREDDGWRIVLRQADAITTPRPIDSIIEQ